MKYTEYFNLSVFLFLGLLPMRMKTQDISQSVLVFSDCVIFTHITFPISTSLLTLDRLTD